MATWVALTLRQGNAETVIASITPSDPTDSLAAITKLVAVIKDDQCTLDSDSATITLSSLSATQIVLTTHTAASIVAEIYVPATALVVPYSRWWRLDAYVGTAKRTAMYGPVTVIAL